MVVVRVTATQSSAYATDASGLAPAITPLLRLFSNTGLNATLRASDVYELRAG
jgi:hypothetical protein